MIEIAKFMGIILFLTVLGAGAGGCSMLDKVGLGREAGAPAESAPTATVYYTGTAGLPLYRSPGRDIISRLPRYSKLYRDDLQRGYAHVRVDATGETGWVENAQLIWRLPAQASPPQPAEPASAPAATEPVPDAVKPPESTTPAATPSSGTPSQPTVSPSIFNPY
jgi:hypothetical protein